jgi:hypothetical protein
VVRARRRAGLYTAPTGANARAALG